MSANPHANGGILLRDLVMPDFRKYAVDVPTPGTAEAESTRVLGAFLRDVMKLNLGVEEFSRLRPGRNCVEPAGIVLRSQRQRMARADSSRGRKSSRPMAACSKS